MILKAALMRRARTFAARQFAAHPDVTGVGIGENYRDGSPTRQHALVVLVDRKGRGRGEPLPDALSFEGHRIPIDVQQMPKDQFRLGNAALDGSDMLIASRVNRTGTLGLLVQEAGAEGRIFGITNAHVVSRPNENHVGDPVDAIVGANRLTIGAVAYQSAYGTAGRNNVDLALVALNAAGVARARLHAIQTLIGTVVGSGHLSFSRFGGALRSHTYSGSSGAARAVVHCGQISEQPRVFLRDQTGALMPFGRTFIFSALSGPVAPGHSGSVLVRQGQNGLIVEGLLAGGGAQGAFVFSFSDVLRELANAGIHLG